ncbi:hypothetical protein NP233_g3100 [Leucocoprinus birnbaumii]|uniref:Uncharacterized protein n=1 Tax=Leucocoprinus birnbaumii TaxID=56174 RepID=A0AAD5W3K5_9AGAR|nr:hypothetical protein NP233_g3100 [Leucocoprinus birnbaumii]
MLRKGGLGSTPGSAGSDSYVAGTSPGHEGHGHAHYATLAAGASAGEGTGAGGSGSQPNGKVLTPSPSPPVGSTAAGAATSPAGASASVPSAASGSLGLHLSGTSPTSSSPSLSVPSIGSGLPPPPPPATSISSASTISQPDSSAQDLGFVHYNTPATQAHERVIPPLNVHSHSHPVSHTHHSHPSSPHSHPHSPSSGSTSSGSHPHSPLPGFSAAAHHVYSGYTTRPSPLSQAGNIVTGPAAGVGPLTPHSATADGGLGSANSSGGQMQLPPLAHMDRLVGSSGHGGYGHHYGPFGVKSEYEASDSDTPTGHLHHQQLHTASSNMNKEPLTPLSAQSPIGPAVGRSHHSSRRTILGGGQ